MNDELDGLFRGTVGVPEGKSRKYSRDIIGEMRVPPEFLAQVVNVVRAGLTALPETDPGVASSLGTWCDDMRDLMLKYWNKEVHELAGEADER